MSDAHCTLVSKVRNLVPGSYPSANINLPFLAYTHLSLHSLPSSLLTLDPSLPSVSLAHSVEELAATATDAFSSYIPVVLPLLLSSLSVPKGISAAVINKKDLLVPPLKSLEQTLHCYNSLRGERGFRHTVLSIALTLLDTTYWQ